MAKFTMSASMKTKILRKEFYERHLFPTLKMRLLCVPKELKNIDQKDNHQIRE